MKMQTTAIKLFGGKLFIITLMLLFCATVRGKTSEEKSNNSAEIKVSKNDAPGLLFADELKQIIERYMFGICPQPIKLRWSQMVGSKKNATAPACDLDTDQQDLAGRLATLALRAHATSRSDCGRLGAALANTLGELARTASSRQVLAAAAVENKKRKLSKSQKKQIQAKQRTALAVKKKAAAVAAANAAKQAATT